MAFAGPDLDQFLAALRAHPEWRSHVRAEVLGEELLTLPEVVRDLADAQRRTEAKVQDLVDAQRRTEARVEELAEAQRRTEARVEELAEAQRRTEARVEELAEAQRRTEARVEELAEAQRRTEAKIEGLIDAQRRTEASIEELAEAQRQTETRLGELIKQVSNLAGRTGNLEGLWYEDQWERHAPAKMGLHLKRGKIVWITDIPELDNALADGRISRADWEDLVALDVIVWGSDRVDPAKGSYYAAVEISRTVDESDVARAARRADLLGRLGVPARPFVGGQAIGADAADLAARLAVTIVVDRAAA
jgi:hypothetical protein